MKTPINLRPIALATLIAMMASLTACGGNKPPTQANNPAPVKTEQPTVKPDAPKPAVATPSPSPDASQSQGLTSEPEPIAEAPQPDSQAAPPPQSEPRQNAEVPVRPAQPSGVQMGNIAYMASETTPDAGIEQAIVESLGGDRTALRQTHYYYDRIDLNGDSNPEALVYLSGSYTCGSGGCTMLVLQPSGQNYQLVSKMTLVNSPIIVSDEKTSGWKDIVLEVAGGGTSKHYARMQFDGNAYPRNPSTAPELGGNTVINGTAVIHNDITAEGGIPLQGEG